MTEASTTAANLTIGIDLGDRTSHVCVLDAAGDVIESGTIATKPAAIRRRFERCEPTRIAIEAGGQSAWIGELLTELGHDVVVANARRLRMIYENDSKSDEVDAEQLARVARLDPKLLYPIQHRERRTRIDLAKLRARDALVATRTGLINHVRGTMKSFGQRLGARGAPYFHGWVRDQIPEDLRLALDPVVDLLEMIAGQIGQLETEIERMARDDYPETNTLRQVNRVGLHCSLRFVLTVEDPLRIRRSRDVGAYFGLRPKKRQSGKRDPEMRITKAGDEGMRRLLVQCAQQMLGPFGRDSDLRRWGLELASKGGKATKKKAVIAVARKLAVLLHVLWKTGQVYEPLRHAEPGPRAALATA
jgi:transposase